MKDNLKFDTLHLKPLSAHKKIFFASDFHLGIPDRTSSLLREQKIVAWMERIQEEAHALFLLGDIFDFWFEYKYVIPKGFVRLQGKLAAFTDLNIPVFLFPGNHDFWMYDYFPQMFNIPILKHPSSFTMAGKKFLVGHGDELGASKKYRRLKRFIYANPLCQWAFGKLPSSIGVPLAHSISGKTRRKTHSTVPFTQENEPIFNFCKQKIEPHLHHDFYVFGHIHFPLAFRIHEKSAYYNVGDWINHFTYGLFDGKEFKVLKFE